MKVLEYSDNSSSVERFAISINLSVATLEEFLQEMKVVKESYMQWIDTRKERAAFFYLLIEADASLHDDIAAWIRKIYAEEEHLSILLPAVDFEVTLESTDNTDPVKIKFKAIGIDHAQAATDTQSASDNAVAPPPEKKMVPVVVISAIVISITLAYSLFKVATPPATPTPKLVTTLSAQQITTMIKQQRSAGKAFERAEQENTDGTSWLGDIELSPVFLAALFGAPTTSDGLRVSGTYTFKSISGEVFTLYDYKSTTRWDEHNGLPTPDEFWASNEKQTLSIGGYKNSDYRALKSWLLRTQTMWLATRKLK